jgi:WD40 repeat protein
LANLSSEIAAGDTSKNAQQHGDARLVDTLSDDDWDTLVSRIKKGDCTPFLGAGISADRLPTGSQIAADWSARYEYPLPDTENLIKVSQLVGHRLKDFLRPNEIIKDIIEDAGHPNFLDPTEPHAVLAKLPLPVYMTTNYDDFMFKALQTVSNDPPKEPTLFVNQWNSPTDKPAARVDLNPSANKPAVYHFHGHKDQLDTMVLTEDDYLDFLVRVSKDQELIPPRIQHALVATQLLFIGYSLGDMNFRVIFRGLVEATKKNMRRVSIAVQTPPNRPRNLTIFDTILWIYRNPSVLGKCPRFCRGVGASLEGSPVTDTLEGAKALISHDRSSSLNPYVGPRPFERNEGDLFFARDQDARDIISLIIANDTFIIYSQSGAGKNSLLNTRIIGGLEQNELAVLPIVRIQGKIPVGTSDADVENVFALNAILSLEGDVSAGFIKEYGRIPIADYICRIRKLGRLKADLPVVLIFDQFEEFFSFYDYRWGNRVSFIEQLTNALSRIDDLHLVFAMREDYIANFDTYARLFANRLRARYRLERLRKAGAIQAIEGPAGQAGRKFAEGVAEQIVHDLLQTRTREISGRVISAEGEFIEAVQLQVVCHGLWASVPAQEHTITRDDLKNFGTVDEVLRNFYESTISQATRVAFAFDLNLEWPKHAFASYVRFCNVAFTRLAVTLAPAVLHRRISEFFIRRWFDSDLITSAGTRGTVFRGDRGTAGMPNALVEFFSNRYLIRGDWRAGAQWYEITHDRLLRPIKDSNRAWFKRMRRWPATIVAIAIVAGLSMVVVQIREKQRALAALQLSTTLVNDSGRLPFSQLDRAMLLSVAAYQIDNTVIAPGNLLRQVQRVDRLLKFGRIGSADIRAETLVPGSNLIATLAADGALRTWDYLTGATKTLDKRVTPGANALLADVGNLYVVGSGAAVQAVSISDSVLPSDPAGTPALIATRIRSAVTGDETLSNVDTKLGISSANRESPAVTFALASGRLAASRGGSLQIMDVNSGTVIATFAVKAPATSSSKESSPTEPPVQIISLGLSSDGKFVFAAGCRLIRTGELGKSSAAPPPQAAGSPQQAPVCGSYFAQIWEIDAQRDLGSENFDSSAVRSMAIAHSGDRLFIATSQDDGRIQMQERSAKGGDTGINRSLESIFVGDPGSGLIFSATGDALISVLPNGVASSWSVNGARRLARKLYDHFPRDLAFSPGGRLALAGEFGYTILDQVFGPEPHQVFAKKAPEGLPNKWSDFSAVALDNDGRRLAIGGESTLDVISLDDGKPIFSVRPAPVQTASVAVDASGLYVASGYLPKVDSIFSARTEVPVLWRVGNRDPLLSIDLGGSVNAVTKPDNPMIAGVAFSPSEKYFAAAKSAGTVEIYMVSENNGSAKSFVLASSVSIPNGRPYFLAFSPDSKLLAVSGANLGVVLVDPQTAVIREPRGDPGATILRIAFNRDGGLLAGATERNTVRLWDARLNLQFVAEISLGEPSFSDLTGLAFSPDGRWLVSGSNSDATVAFDLNPESWVKEACAIAGRSVTAEDWSKYVGSSAPKSICHLQ